MKQQRVATEDNPQVTASKREKDANIQFEADLKSVMQDPAGRRIMWSILGMCGLYTNTFDHSGSKTAFNCGRQSVGQQILGEINNICPYEYLEMQKEQLSKLNR